MVIATSAPSSAVTFRTGALFAITGVLLFGLNGTVAKTALHSGLDSRDLVTWRIAGAAACLLAVLVATRLGTGRPVVVWRGFRRAEGLGLLVLGVVGVGLTQWLYFVAIARLDIGLALLLEFLAPVYVVLWTRFARRAPVRRRMWWALGAVVVGLGLVAQIHGGRLDALGVAAGLLDGVCLAVYYLLGGRVLARHSALGVQTWSMVVAAAFWCALRPPWRADLGSFGVSVPLPAGLPGDHAAPLWAFVAWVVVLGTVAPFALDLGGLARLGPVHSGMIDSLEPVAAGAMAWVLLGESLTWVQVLGGVVVMAGIAVAGRSRVAPPPARPADPPAARDRVAPTIGAS